MVPCQSFKQSATVWAYESEETKYLKEVKRVLRKQMLRDANMVSSHVVYKGKSVMTAIVDTES